MHIVDSNLVSRTRVSSISSNSLFYRTLKLNIDNTDKVTHPPRDLLPELNGNDYYEGERAKRKRRQARRRKTMRNSRLFEESRVHIYIGGGPQDTKFVGCIGNIRIDG